MDMKILKKVIEDTKNEEIEDKNKKVTITSHFSFSDHGGSFTSRKNGIVYN